MAEFLMEGVFGSVESILVGDRKDIGLSASIGEKIKRDWFPELATLDGTTRLAAALSAKAAQLGEVRLATGLVRMLICTPAHVNRR